jgi:23S rRNA (adenine-N6)-dimethyltransferase
VAVRPRSPRGRGQHFLRSSSLAAELVRAARIGPDDLVLDIGAGTGVLTKALVQRAGRVVAVEINSELAAALRHRFGSVEVVEADALRAELPGERFKVVSNLPFDGGTAILRRLLDPRVKLVTADVVVEWGLASKRAAVWPSTQLSAYWGAWFELSIARRLPRCVFAPPPSVDAAVLRAVRRVEPLVAVRDACAYSGFLARSFQAGLPASATTRELKRLADVLGFARDARPRDLDAAQLAGVFHAVRRSR